MPASVGVWYEREGYDTSGQRLMGRQSAGESFLKALLRHSASQRLYCVTHGQEQYHDCLERISSWGIPRQMTFLPTEDPWQLATARILYRPDAALPDLAWLRRFAGQRLYSLCGIVHSVCTKDVMRQFGQLAIAPVQPWDALICTSKAVKTAIEGMLAYWTDYLATRCGARPAIPVQLPVIPLGIDAASFAPTDQTRSLGAKLREKLAIGTQDIVLLYVGRLNFYAKAHPIPMYLAAEAAARKAPCKLYLLQVGWFG
jgi:hypothetical protein